MAQGNEWEYIDDAPVPVAGKAAPRRGIVERAKDSYGEAIQYGFPGLASRKIHDWINTGKDELRRRNPNIDENELERMSDDLISQAQRDLRSQYIQKREQDPTWRPDESWVDNLISGRWIPYLAGQVAGSAGPENLLMPGASAAARIAGQAGISGASDLAYQGADVADNVADEIDPAQVAASAALGGLFQGGVEGVGRLVRGKSPDLPEGYYDDALHVNVTADERPLAERSVRELADLEEEGVDVERILNTPETPDQILGTDRYDTPAPEGAPHPEDVGAPKMTSTWEQGRGMDERMAAQYDRRIRNEKQAQALADEAATTPVEPEAPVIPEAANDLEAPPIETPAATEAPKADVVTRLTDALNNANKLSGKQRDLYLQSRRQKLAKVMAAREKTGGEAGYRAELAQLRGELDKVDFEGVRDQFSQEDIDSLFNSIKNNPDLTVFEQINARKGLTKLFDGRVPNKSEISLMERTFPKEFVEAAVKNRSTKDKVLSATANALNLPRSLMSSFDLSAPFRQAVFLTGRKQFWGAWQDMFKQFGSEKAFRAAMDDIRARETYPLMERSGLSITEAGSNLTNREENFVSTWAEKLPGIGRGVRASERGYTGFLNKVRADTFDDIVRKSQAAGIDFEANPKALNDIASFVNAATGRGSLGKLEEAGPMLNGLFFSPRLMSSRLTLLNPMYYAQLSPVVRKEAIKSLLSFGAIAGTVTALAQAGGADVESDPRSSDFAKLKYGNTRYDILGGFGQYLTLGARLATNEKKTLKGDIQELGKKYGSDTRLDVGLNFLINKESPIASFVTDYLRGKDPVGEPFEAKKAVAERFIPMFMQDLYEVQQEEGLAKGTAMAIPSAFGVGIQTFEPRESKKEKKAKDEWQYMDDVNTEGGDLASNVARDLGVRVTDSGTRTRGEQEYLFRNFRGAAPPGSSSHESGNAIDIAPRKGLTREDVKKYFEDQGMTDIKIITKKHGTGPHWHVQWKGQGDNNGWEYVN